MKKLAISLGLSTFVATAALAHQGVKNEAVMARMMLMEKIGKATKTLGEMAKGETEFNSETANAAARRIAEHAVDIGPLFEARESDPKSEALPAIWENYNDFTAKADELARVATEIDVESRADLRNAMKELGGTCRSCHADYRE